jgi:F-type H+-transporting ATPase subunit delta
MDSILAKRYAKALLELGLEDGNHKAYGEELSALSGAIQGAGAAGRLLVSPVLPAEEKALLLDKIIAAAGLSPLVANFVRLLDRRGRLGLLAAASRAYASLEDEHEGIARGYVLTAGPLGDAQLGAIREALSRYVGKTVLLEQREDPSVIGGVVARVGDLEVDGSVRARLARLAAAFQGH